ncbi:MAG: IPT/TIG domain-containing protein [Candidatus Bathyarchaeota archaeon]
MNAYTGKKGGALPELRKGSVIEVTGGGVTAGATINLYWDNAFKETFSSGSGKLNSTTAKNTGAYTVRFKIPEAVAGAHYIWVKDTATGDTLGGITVAQSALTPVPYLKLSPTTGLAGDTITLTGYHFGDEVDITPISDNFVDSYPSPLEATETPATPETTDLGTFTCTFKVPATTAYGSYTITATDTTNTDTVPFTVGAAISLNIEEGPVGKVVQVSGRGFTSGRNIEKAGVTISATQCYVINDPVVVKADGTFKASIVIPQVASTNDYTITVTESGASPKSGTADFEVVGLAEIKATPAYGPQGSQITVEGWNFTQISNTNVVVTLATVGSKTFKTDSKGYFKGIYTVPAVAAGVQTLMAEQASYNIDADANFRAGLMIVILSPNSGPAGTKVTLTGTGFTTGGTTQWNATFGNNDWVDETILNTDGTLSKEVYVPTITPGAYTVTVLDIDAEIEVTASFTVTKTTNVTPDPLVAPNGYKVKFKGTFFAADDDDTEDVTLDWVLWNATSNWDMDVYNNTLLTIDSLVWDTGNFTAYWEVPDDDTLDLGVYWVNVTDSEDLFYQFQFEVVSKTTAITPRKATFRISETVAFNVQSSFSQVNSYIKVWDPASNLYWKTDLFVTGNWIKVGTLQVYPFYEQTAGGNPMVLLEDAPLGTYTWKWYDEDDEVVSSGTLMVAAATESVLGAQIEDLNKAVTDLQTDISTVSTEMAGVRTQITNAINAANAAVQAANAATQAVNAVAQTASAASTAATNAANAATEAKNAANGLTTLVYGAIGASLVAALAAIVSLMQISRRIAG